MKTIKFTRGERAAMMHRLSLWDCIFDVFADTDSLAHLSPEDAANRAREFYDQLEAGKALVVDESNELDKEVLAEVIEGSTWVAVNSERSDGGSRQKEVAAYRTLCRCADKVSLAFDILVSDIDIPTV